MIERVVGTQLDTHNEFMSAMGSFTNFIARLFGKDKIATENRDELGKNHSTDNNDEVDWTEKRMDEIQAEIAERRITTLNFPGFSPLWNFGTEYCDSETKSHYGPDGWYGRAYESGGSHFPEGWLDISSQFGKLVSPSAEAGYIQHSPHFHHGFHVVGPEPDPTSALSAIMKYVLALEEEREKEFKKLKAEYLGTSDV